MGGVRILDRVASALRDVTGELLLVANDPAAPQWLPGIRVVADLTPGLGPLGGIQAALHATDGDVLVVAWDMPFVTPGLLRELARRGSEEGAIVVPEGKPGRAEPTCAFYPADCRDALDTFLAGGDRTPSRFLASYGRVERLLGAELERFGDPMRLLTSVNAPADLVRWGEEG